MLPCQWDFKSFGLPLWKRLLIVKILPVTLFKMLVAAIQESANDFFCKLFLKPEIILRFWSVLQYYFSLIGGWLIVGFFKGWIELHNSLWVAASLFRERGRISDAASVKISRIISVIKEASKNFKITFLYNSDEKKTIGAYKESTDLMFRTFQTIIHLVTLSL